MRSRYRLRSYLLLVGFLSLSFLSAGQWWKKTEEAEKERSKGMLLLTSEVQIEATNAINQMYNFKFPEAEREFNYLKVKHPDHPLPDFLLGLVQWWKIVPNTQNEVYDDRLLEYMDRSISKAEKIWDETENPEAAFFMAAAYGFKGRLHSERKHWARATLAAKSALKYLEYSREFADFSPELMFGDGLYNYYYHFIKQNFKLLRPVLWLFPKANKQQGIEQLEKVSYQAFYTRTEARYFLLQIYAMENMSEKSYELAKYTHQNYPDNPFFERYHARSAFMLGKLDEAMEVSKSILNKIDNHQVGYEGVSGRYASYILGYYQLYIFRNSAEAKIYFKKCMDFSIQTASLESGYYWASVLGLARIAYQEGDYDTAVDHCKEVMDKADKKTSQYTEAKKLLSEAKKARRKKK
ncbi:tetratricopeptide repeat protein [Aquirufa aurantiipilula]|uniref:Tetratricopeptide repeat protein n=1 Tax=Aquirufa aurantiipilula TaxID=2696561 RepID=A0ABT6BI17_9BACT|nr:tetratricopeptide repeat protein [Aquirufa aurantiipilula]MBZ1327250.1 tetratricopeptide repeat protein [Aquirufa aurantiipilula]MDF5690098.1 tetratricopeptide repeat protein [Aquirufa aurantiipilula]